LCLRQELSRIDADDDDDDDDAMERGKIVEAIVEK
jgi:hypothetical protein